MLPHCFARLSLRRLGNNKQGVCATHTAKIKRDNFQMNLKSSLSCFWLFEQHLICYCSRSPRDSVGARTQNLQLRRLLLYPVELRNQTCFVQNRSAPPHSKIVEPISGFEPETPSLRVKCSTAELNRQTRLAISFSFHKVSNNFYSKAVCY